MPFPYTFPVNWMSADYEILVDWNNDGDYTDVGEEVTKRVLVRQPLKMRRGRDQISLLSPPIAGTAGFLLDNQSRDYSPDNAAGPLYGSLLPGRKVRVLTQHGGLEYDLFTGFLFRMRQRPRQIERSVAVEALGPLSRLMQKTGENKISTQLYENIATSTAVGHILDAVGWPAGDRVIDTGKTIMTYWWLEDEDPFQALLTVLLTEGPGGCIYEQGDGDIVFESRHYRFLTTRSKTSQATFRDVSSSEPAFGPQFGYDDGWDAIINECSIELKTREVAAAMDVVWEYGSELTLSLRENEVRDLTVHATDPFKEAIAPVENTDYVIVLGGISSVTLDRTSGQSCTMTITAGVSGATISYLQLRAKTISTVGTTTIKNTIDCSASIAKYGKRAHKWAARPDISLLVAQDFVNGVVWEYREPRAKVEFALVNRSNVPLVQALSREISDRITLIEPQTGLNGDYWIEQITHEIEQGGALHRCLVGCERITGPQQYWQLGIHQLGTTTRLGW